MEVDEKVMNLENVSCLKTYCPEPEEVFFSFFFFFLFSPSPSFSLFLHFRLRYAKITTEIFPFLVNPSSLFAVFPRFLSKKKKKKKKKKTS